ncbi:MAG TPA: hypothetical protein VJS67_12150, partial [Pseudonocardiaceae bacterium]|nr:hypothetical protein [Pseudonocardiaceae bacterium]
RVREHCYLARRLSGDALRCANDAAQHTADRLTGWLVSGRRGRRMAGTCGLARPPRRHWT